MKKILFSLLFLLSIAHHTSVGQTQEELKQLKQLYDSQSKTGEQPTNKTPEINRQREEILDSISPIPNLIAPKIDAIDLVYGKNIFSNKNLSFAPNLNSPTPKSYILGAGDEVIIDVWGEAQENIIQKISPDGYITLAGVGPVRLSGMDIKKAEELIRAKMASKIESLVYGGSQMKLTLGNTRTIQVNIIGEVITPGTYRMPSFSSLFNALYATGGISELGSLREIKLFRNGKEISSLDIYDYLLHGNNSINMHLDDNDLIIVSPYKNIVTITGGVKRPHSYELKDGETLAKLVQMSGGFQGNAFSDELTVVRKSGKQQQIYTVKQANFDGFTLKDKDEVSVRNNRKDFENRLTITGAVWREGEYELSENTSTVLALINTAGGLREDAYSERANIVRTYADKTKELIPINIEAIMLNGAPDVTLQKEDIIHIESYLNLEQLKTVRISGCIRNDTIQHYAYYPGMTLEDLVIMAGGLSEDASLTKLEISRRIKEPMSKIESEHKVMILNYTIPEDLSFDSNASSFNLEPYDEVFVRRSPAYHVQEHVQVNGMVLFPGEYTISYDEERLSSFIINAGGLKDKAYAKGASLRRKATASDLERLKSVKELSTVQSISDSTITPMRVGDYYSVGINLEEALKYPQGNEDIILNPDDIIFIPTYSGTVKISGAVNHQNITNYSPGTNLRDYIAQAGGFLKQANKKGTFIIYMNGKVQIAKKGKIEPGCEIIVPQKPERRSVSTGEIVGVSTSAVSLIALITSLFVK